jgi:PIN domain nuclease of toxin-antitoxin system
VDRDSLLVSSTTIYVVDTHALVRFLTGDSSLGPRARTILADARSHLVVPIHSFEEIRRKFFTLDAKTMVRVPPAVALRLVAKCSNMKILPRGLAVFHEEKALKQSAVGRQIPGDDISICATAIAVRNATGRPVILITRDGKIRRSGIIPTVW